MPVRFIRGPGKNAPRGAPQRPASRSGGATPNSRNGRLLVAPEEWFRASYPGVFIDDEERVFADRDGELVGFSSEFLVARCLGRGGNRDSPVAYCPEEEQFYAYSPTTGLYERLTVERVRQKVVELLERCARGCRREYRAEILALRTRRVISAVTEALKAESPISADEFEPDYFSVAVENGMLDIRTLRLAPFSPKRPVRFKLPIAWDPSAADPAEFWAYLHAMVPAEEDRSLLVDSLGMAFTGNPFQRIVVLLGPGGAGKTTFVKLLASLIGLGDTAQFRPDHAGDRFESCSWIGKKLLYLTEAQEDSLLGCSKQLKEISGQDTMTAEFKSSNIRRNFTPRALLVITGNPDLRLRIQEDRDAWERRLILLRVAAPEHQRRIPEFEKYLVGKEGPGILRIVVEAAHRLVVNGMPELSSEQNRRVQRLLDASDPFKEFVGLHVERQPGSCVYTADAYAAVKAFLGRNHYHVPPDGELRKRVIQAMADAHLKTSNSLDPCQGKSQRGWRGIRLRAPSEVPGF